MRTYQKWLSIEEQYLKENYNKVSRQDLAAFLGRTLRSITSRMELLKLRNEQSELWTPDEIIYLMANFHKKSWPELFNDLPRHKYDGIKLKASKLGLSRKSDNYLMDSK